MTRFSELPLEKETPFRTGSSNLRKAAALNTPNSWLRLTFQKESNFRTFFSRAARFRLELWASRPDGAWTQSQNLGLKDSQKIRWSLIYSSIKIHISGFEQFKSIFDFPHFGSGENHLRTDLRASRDWVRVDFFLEVWATWLKNWIFWHRQTVFADLAALWSREEVLMEADERQRRRPFNRLLNEVQ